MQALASTFAVGAVVAARAPAQRAVAAKPVVCSASAGEDARRAVRALARRAHAARAPAGAQRCARRRAASRRPRGARAG
jgi:hypothetical protein